MKTKYIIAIVVIFLLWNWWSKSKKVASGAAGSQSQQSAGNGIFSWLPAILQTTITDPVTGETIVPPGPLVHEFFTEEEKQEDNPVIPSTIVPIVTDPVNPADTPIFSTAGGSNSSAEKSGFNQRTNFWKRK